MSDKGTIEFSAMRIVRFLTEDALWGHWCKRSFITDWTTATLYWLKQLMPRWNSYTVSAMYLMSGPRHRNHITLAFGPAESSFREYGPCVKIYLSCPSCVSTRVYVLCSSGKRLWPVTAAMCVDCMYPVANNRLTNIKWNAEFHILSHAVWNNLVSAFRDSGLSLNTFKQKLKTAFWTLRMSYSAPLGCLLWSPWRLQMSNLFTSYLLSIYCSAKSSTHRGAYRLCHHNRADTVLTVNN